MNKFLIISKTRLLIKVGYCSGRTQQRMIQKAENAYMATVNAENDRLSEHDWHIVADMDDCTFIHSN